MSFADYGFAIWETFYVTVLSTAFSLVLGLPLGVLLVAGDKDGVLPLPGWLMHILNIVINILRSVPFLILMICVFPLTRAIVGTTVGTKATIVPLVVAAFPFVARLVETSLRELDEGVVEAAQSMGATPFQIITKVTQTDFLALEQHLTHAVYGDVEDCADVSSRINTTMRGDVLGKLLDGHDVSVLRDGESILLLSLHEFQVLWVRGCTLLLCLVDA